MFSIGDVVRICDDLERLREWQFNHGEYIDEMRGCVGKLGKVVKVYPDGDVRVSVDENTWTLNPLCLVAAPGSPTEISNTMTANAPEEPATAHLEPPRAAGRRLDAGLPSGQGGGQPSRAQRDGPHAPRPGQHTAARPCSWLGSCPTPQFGPESVPRGRGCLICLESYALVTFRPCGHRITCAECCPRMKNCLTCEQLIEKKIDPMGCAVEERSPAIRPAVNLQEHLHTVNRVRELEEELQTVNRQRELEKQRLLELEERLQAVNRQWELEKQRRLELEERLQTANLQWELQKQLLLELEDCLQTANRQWELKQRLQTVNRQWELEKQRLQELEEAVMCGVCLEGRRNVAFLCGHAACAVCAQVRRRCHMCQQPITLRVPLR